MLRGDAGGKQFLMSDGVGVGYGARPTADGIDAVYFVAQENYPVEFLELGYPVRLRRYGIHRDSGGPGKFRGGCGIVREYEVLAEQAVLSVRIDSVMNPPWGVAGGMQGGTGRAVVNPGTPHERVLAPLSDGKCCGAATSCCSRPAAAAATATRSTARPNRCCRTCWMASSRSRRQRRDYGVVIARASSIKAATQALRSARRWRRHSTAGICRCHRLTLAVAVDIGGTFTDITLARSATGRLWRAKTPSTPADPSEAFLAGVMLALTQASARPQRCRRACCTAPPSPRT